MEKAYIKTISEVEKLVNSNLPLNHMQLTHASCTAGCGNIIDILLMIPESVILFISPLGCGRHISIYPQQRTGRVYTCVLDEKDLVVGSQLEILDEAIQDILEKANVRPKLISVCGSCVDMLLGTDYESECRILSEKYNLPILVTYMAPVIGNEHPAVRVYRSIFELICLHRTGEPKKLINSIGRLTAYEESSEIYTLLEKCGYEVRHLSQCTTMDEFYEMGDAAVNLIGHPKALAAAQMMKEKFDIPYIAAFPTFDIEYVSRVYRQLEEVLQIQIEDEALHTEAQNHLETARKNMEGKILATGESNVGTWNAFDNALVLKKAGFDVKYVFSINAIGGESAEIKELAKLAPDLKVINEGCPNVYELVLNPLHVDAAIGLWEDWFYHRPETKDISFVDHPQLCDYDTIIRLSDSLMEVTV
jgi:nitrogenase molybdenum-cofactor synthesis protein NifE